MPTSVNNTLPATLKSTEQLQETMHRLLKQALQKGASDAEVSIEQDNGFSVDVRMGEIDTLTFHDAQTISLTLYCGQQKGSASTSDMNPKALESIVNAAFDIASVSSADPCFGLADKTLLNKMHPDLDLYYPWSLTPEAAIQLAKHCEHEALAQDKAIVNSNGVNISSYTGGFGYANTHGAEGIVYSSRHNMSCSLVAEKNGKSQTDYDYTTARCADDLISSSLLAKRAASRTLKRLGAQKIKTMRTPVLFESRIASHLISAFIAAISGGNLYRKQSFLLDSIGKTVFPEGFHIQEHPYLLKGLGSSAFDAEGVTTRENIFIEDGRVKQYVLSSYTARRLGLETSANAGGVHNLTVKTATTPDFNHLLKQMDTGLLVTELMGDGINILTGDYSKGASGFWVENGEIQYPVEEITIASTLQTLFKHIVAVGADIDPNRATRCGSILVEEMMIAGI